MVGAVIIPILRHRNKGTEIANGQFSELVLHLSGAEPTATTSLGSWNASPLCYTDWPEGVALVPINSAESVDPPAVNVAESGGMKVDLSCSCQSLKVAEAFGSHA